jgi:hypothetical protein
MPGASRWSDGGAPLDDFARSRSHAIDPSDQASFGYSRPMMTAKLRRDLASARQPMAPRPQQLSDQGFKPVTPAEAQQAHDAVNAPLPASFQSHTIGDPGVALPDESRRKLESLRQRAADARSLFEPVFDQIRETRIELDRSRSRLRQLIMPRNAGGFGLSQGDENTPADKQVADVQAIITKHEGELSRLASLEAERSANWRSLGILVQRCEDWLRSGRPLGTVLLESAALDLDEIVKPDEKFYAAIERLRHRLRELSADEHRVRSSAYPSAHCKQKVRDTLDSIANRGTPSVDMLIEHDGEITWPMARRSVTNWSRWTKMVSRFAALRQAKRSTRLRCSCGCIGRHSSRRSTA